jgi:hypothetical protein
MNAQILQCGEKTCTIGAGAQLDFAIISRTLATVMSISSVVATWKPHFALVLSIASKPRQVMISKLQVPAELPIPEFKKAWDLLPDDLKHVADVNSQVQADAMLQLHAIEHNGPAILGQADPCFQNDPKFADPSHINSGEMLASAALHAELLVCNVVGIPPEKFIGRSQYPCISIVPALPKKRTSDKFSSPAANWWGCLDNMLIKYLESRTNDFKHHKHIHRIHLHLASINTHGKAVDSDELVAALDANKNHEHFSSSWKDDAAEVVDTHLGIITWKDALLHLDIHPDSVLAQIQVAAGLLRDTAIRSRSKNSSASWKKFCVDQLTKGAGKLHSWANRPNSLPSVPLFDNTTKSKTPLAVLQDKTKHWSKYWQKPSERNALEVIVALRTACKKALDANSTSNVWDAPTFDGDALTLSAKKV